MRLPPRGLRFPLLYGRAYRVRRVGSLDTLALEEEAHRGDSLALALAKGRHQLLQLRASLDLEEDLVVVVRDLDVEVLRGAACGALAGRVLGAVLAVVGHGGRGRDSRWVVQGLWL